MYLTSDYATPLELTGYAREALMDQERNQFTLSRFLPSVTISDLTARFARGGEGLVESGKFRSWDTESPTLKRPGISRVTVELPPISNKILLDEYTTLKQRSIGAEVQGMILNDVERNVNAIAARIERTRGEALVNGSITLTNENGVSNGVDFGRDSSMEPTVGTAWDHETSGALDADPIADLLSWFEAYVTLNGSEPGVIVTSRKVLMQMLRVPAVRAYVYGNVDNGPAVLTPAQLNQTLNAYGLPTIELYDAQVSVDGSATRVIAQDRLLMLPDPNSVDGGQLGKTFWGETAESGRPEFAGVQAGIVAGTYHSFDPVATWTKASAIALPVLANPNLVLSVDVLSA